MTSIAYICPRCKHREEVRATQLHGSHEAVCVPRVYCCACLGMPEMKRDRLSHTHAAQALMAERQARLHH